MIPVGRSPRLTVLSCRGDHHGAIVAEKLRQLRRGDLDYRIVDMDAASTDGGIAWELGESSVPSLKVKDAAGNWFEIARSDLIWCRRFSRPQLHDYDDGMLTNQWRQTAKIIADLRDPIWKDHPSAILAAESKPAQLVAARQSGMKTPETLVSQDPNAIRAFFDRCDGEMIAKPVKGHLKRQMLTVSMNAAALENDAALNAFPAIYQRKISGDHHLRVVVLQESAQVFSIHSSDLDWRRRNDIRIEATSLPDAKIATFRQILRHLDLTMGVFDAKYDDTGELWFLEVNPQGQFFFLEALGGVDLAALYAQDLQSSLQSRIEMPLVG